MDSQHFSPIQTQTEVATFISKVYAWMFAALTVTAVVAYWVANTPELIQWVVGSKLVFYGLIFAELGCVIWLSARVGKMSAALATSLFMGYAILNGITMSVIFLIYTSGSISITFLITAGTFGAMSLYGYYTKQDLTSIGNLSLMVLVGLIIASVVNYFLQSEILYWITTYAGVLIFVGLTAYDTQKIKNLGTTVDAHSEAGQKMAVMGALALYLDFVNLFLYLLRFFGRRK